MLRCEIGLEHQLRISVLLVHVVACMAKLIVRIVDGTIHHQGQRCVMLVIENETIFPLRFQPMGVHVNPIMRQGGRLTAVMTHATGTFVEQRLDAPLTDP